MHFDSEHAKQWVNDHLVGMLHQMNVEEEYAIAGRPWFKEIRRMIKKHYKVIVVISEDIVSTSRFEAMLYQIMMKQSCSHPCLIPIMFNCTLEHFSDEELAPYVLLHHDDVNLYDRLKKAICDKCC